MTESKGVPVLKSTEALSFDLCLSQPFTTLQSDWKGDLSQSSIEFLFAVDDKSVFFISRLNYGHGCVLSSRPAPESHEFVEGLWNYDLAEFFLCSDTTDHYQEFNLSPNGDWWSALFSSYRKRCEGVDCRMKGVETFSRVTGDKTTGFVYFGISIPRSELKVDIAFSESSRLNVTAIVKTPSQEFLSYNAMPGAEADFHKLNMASQVSLL